MEKRIVRELSAEPIDRSATRNPTSPTSRWSEADILDADLMRLIKEHDNHSAFARLLPRIAPAIDGPLRRNLPAAEFDDGRAEVALRIWSRRAQYQETRGPVRSWVYGISWHYCCDWLRRHGAMRCVPLDCQDLAVADAHAGPAEATEMADWVAHVGNRCHAVLAGFPPYVQISFELRLKGISYATIADTVGRPIGTVAGAVFRVRKQLRAVLDGTVYPISQQGADIMTDDTLLASVLNELNESKDRLKTVEEQVQALADTPLARADRLLGRLRQFIAAGQNGNQGNYQSATNWAEIEDLRDKLQPVKQQLPDTLFRKVWMWLKDARKRLESDAGDVHAMDELRAVEKALSKAVNGMLT